MFKSIQIKLFFITCFIILLWEYYSNYTSILVIFTLIVRSIIFISSCVNLYTWV